MNCKICGVQTAKLDYCTKCQADIDTINSTQALTNITDVVKWTLSLPDHLFFYAVRTFIRLPNGNGEDFNNHLLKTDRLNGDPVWVRLRGYRCSREQDRWVTNPLL